MTCSNPLPGYDAWKLASPYDDERECPICEAVYNGKYQHRCPHGCQDPDIDAEYDRMCAERDARPGDADYVAPIDDGEDF